MSTRQRPEPRETVLAIEAYVPGKSTAPDVDKIFKLSSNETPLGPSPRALEAYHAAGATLSEYPDGSARALREAIGQAFGLDPNVPEVPVPDMSLEQAAEQAFTTRPDYQAAVERIHAAEASRRAAIGEALPSVHVNADYGAIGLTPSDVLSTYSVAGVVNVPIFQGGRARGRLLEADADLRKRRAEADDMRASIYYEVKGAFLDLQTTTQQLEVARKARDLAGQQLTQARDRFAAGVGSNIEVVQAQEAVALATEQVITATYGYDLAKGALIRGVGGTEATLRQLLGGAR